MFKVSQLTENGFEIFVLEDVVSGTKAKVVPSCSAILYRFSVVKDGDDFNVIQSYDSAEDFKNNVTSKGFLGCKLSPFVCRINKGGYHFGGLDYKITKFYLGNNALHGELYDQPFKVISHEADGTKAAISMLCSYDATDPGYPFMYDCNVTYVLEKNNHLKITTTIINVDAGVIPVQDGWHPYFNLGVPVDQLQLEFQSKDLVEFNNELVPTGKLIPYQEYGSIKQLGSQLFDNCFILDFTECQPLCVLRNPDLHIEVAIAPEKSYPYLQIYIPSDRKSIAIENLSSPPDAFNNGMDLVTLNPNEKIDFVTNYIINVLP